MSRQVATLSHLAVVEFVGHKDEVRDKYPVRNLLLLETYKPTKGHKITFLIGLRDTISCNEHCG